MATDPQTPNIGVYIPIFDSDVGSWNLPCNANFSVMDSLASNVVTIGLTNTSINLNSVPPGMPPPLGASWAGPYASQSALIRLTGAITANISVTFPRAGFYIVENLCVVGNSYFVALASSGGGRVIGAPPGQKTHVFNDGTNMDYVDLPPVGSYMDLACSSVPLWMSAAANTVPAWLNCDGSFFNAATYPQLYALMGNNVLPDLRGRIRATLNQGQGRILNGPVDGDFLLNAGGEDVSFITSQGQLPLVNFSGTGPTTGGFGNFVGSDGTSGFYIGIANEPLVGVSHQVSFFGNTGVVTVSSGGSSDNIDTLPPVQMSGLTFIRAG